MSVWPGLFVAPLLFLTSLAVGYALVPLACDTQHPVVLHVATGLAFVLGALITAYEGIAWRRAGRDRREDAGDVGTQHHFLAGVATLLAALSTLALGAQWFAQAVLSPCLT